MKFLVKNAVGLLAVLSLLGSGMQMARAADINCKASTLYPTPQTLIPNISISNTYAGGDLSLGTTIYRNTVNMTEKVGVSCDAAPYSLDSYFYVTSTPSGGGAYMDTDGGRRYVYPTNVPGVGVALWWGGINFSETRAKSPETVFKNDTASDFGTNIGIDFSLIKTGPIASGSVVNASSFPHLKWEISTNGVNIGYAGLPITLVDYSFTGTINFVTQTCTPQDRTVNIGKWNAGLFNTKGATPAPWVDASVQMTGCPTFSGYYGANNPQSSLDSGMASGGTRVGNLFTLSVTPAHGLADSANSIMALESGTDAATGLGVQLRYGKSIDASISQMTDMWTSGSSWEIPLPTDGRSSFKLPLAVRYYQTDARVTPGKANTQFTVNIDYK